LQNRTTIYGACIKTNQVDCWGAETQMLTIEEISFASKEDFAQLHNNMHRLKQQLHRLPYGG
jgi:hypothetical protein